jgi:hypothetical protein
VPHFVHWERKQTFPSLSAVSFLHLIDAMVDMKDERKHILACMTQQ